jgi:hypothetical protein
MTPRVSEQLSPQPFRQWCAWRLDPTGWDRPDSAPTGEALIEQLAFELGLGERRLHRWRKESKTLERIEVEEALHNADVGFWEVYPDVPPVEATGPNRLGQGSKLSDDQVRRLYELHEAGASIRELGRRFWRPLDYRSLAAAEKGIRRGFARLGLPPLGRPGLSHRRCKGIKTWWPDKGRRCRRAPVLGSDFCREHDPARRAEVVATLDRARELLVAA